MSDFEKFMKGQCDGCAYECVDAPEHCTECGGRFKEAYEAGHKAGIHAADTATYDIAYKKGLEEAVGIAVAHATKMQYDNHVPKRVAEAEELGARRVAAAIRERMK